MCWGGGGIFYGVRYFPKGNFPSDNFQAATSQMYIFPNDNFPRGNFPMISELTIFKEKRQYLPHYYSDEGLNWYFWESGHFIKITLIVPLKSFSWDIYFIKMKYVILAIKLELQNTERFWDFFLNILLPIWSPSAVCQCRRYICVCRFTDLFSWYIDSYIKGSVREKWKGV